MNSKLKTILCTILSLSKATVMAFVYLFSIVFSIGLLVELANINLVPFMKVIIIVFIPIVFINDLIKNFKIIHTPQQSNKSSCNKGDLPRPKVKNSAEKNLITGQEKNEETQVSPVLDDDGYVDYTKNT